MCLVNQTAVIFVGAEAWVHFVIVGSGIAVVTAVAASAWHIILKHRGKPQCGHAQFVEVVEVLTNALQVATVAKRWLRAHAKLVEHTLHHIVFHIAIGKAVGHEHIQHVGIGESLSCLTRHVAALDFVVHLFFLAALLEIEFHGAWLSTLQIEIHEQIVGAVEAHHAIHLHTGIVGAYVGLLDALAIHHQLERWIFHTGIPVGGFHTVDVHRRICCECRKQ